MAIYVNLYHGKEYRKAAFIDYYHNSEIPLAANVFFIFYFCFLTIAFITNILY